MDPEMLEELKSSSAGTGLKTPGQQGPPNEGTWEQGRTTANGFLTACVDSSRGGNILSTTECVDTRASEKNTRITADTTCVQQGHKTFSEQNKQFDPSRRREKAPLWNAAVTLPSFSGENWKAPCLLSACASCSVLCVCLFLKFFLSS